MTTFGVEEEFFFLSPDRMMPADIAGEVYHRLAAHPYWGDRVHREFLASQIEHATPVLTELGDAGAQLLEFRREIDADAGRHAMCVAGTGTTPYAPAFPSITDADRYHRVARDMSGVIADHQVCGLHVHVGVPSREQGVLALNAVRPWLPLLVAMSGNSPLWRGAETGYESWRTVQMRRWTTEGCPPRFADAADYDRRIRQLVGVGGMTDLGLLAWNARLSEHAPTIELRVADAQLTTDDTVLIAALCRALVLGAIEAGEPDVAAPAARRRHARAVHPAGPAGTLPVIGPAGEPHPDLPPELLSAAIVHSAQHGLSDTVLDPASGRLVPAGELVRRLEQHLADPLERMGDRELVHELLERLLRDGTGAARQLAAWRRGGIAGIRRLYASTITARPTPSPRRAVERATTPGTLVAMPAATEAV